MEHAAEYGSQWEAIRSIAAKIGCCSETLRRWVRRAERDEGVRPAAATADLERPTELEREVRELRRANEILRLLPRRSSTAYRSDGPIHRRTQRGLWGRADLRPAADRPVDVLRAPRTACQPGAAPAPCEA